MIFGVVLTMLLAMVTTMLVQLLGSLFALKFMALTGGTKQGKGGKQQENAFHRRAV